MYVEGLEVGMGRNGTEWNGIGIGMDDIGEERVGKYGKGKGLFL